MFTGLVIDVGTILEKKPSGTGFIFRVGTRLAREKLQHGESIAVNGVCLTVTAYDAESFTCEASKETIDRSNLGTLREKSPVNLERALALGDRLGGHLVQGHVDGRGKFAGAVPEGTSRILTFDLPGDLIKYVIPKGSIALDGISLTVNEVRGNRIKVNIIPATWEKTNLSGRKAGDLINVEVDLLGKYAESIMGGHIPAPGKKKTPASKKKPSRKPAKKKKKKASRR